MTLPGRACPIDYSLAKDAFNKSPLAKCSTLYVVGGLYGNIEAFKCLEKIIAKDDNSLVVLNGDMHWFDKTIKDFKTVEKMAKSYIPLIGNVEAELRRSSDIGIGCGCSYPQHVSEDIVNRSNIIHKELKDLMPFMPEVNNILKKRNSTATILVGESLVAITHGDEKSISGWECSRESLKSLHRQIELDKWMNDNSIKVLATTHTCAPVALKLQNGVVINNGAAGMPNFKNSLFGLITRISTYPNRDALYRSKIGDIFVEALPLRYDNSAFLKWFDNLWPRESPASISYRNRITNGPDDNMLDALLGGFNICN